MARGVIQYGIFEGAPALEISEFDFDPTDPSVLVKSCLKAMSPGVDFLVLHESLPIESDAFTTNLFELWKHKAFTDTRLWRCIKPNDQRWSEIRTHTVMDCSGLESYDYVSLMNMVGVILQSPDEVIIEFHNHPLSLSAITLDNLLGVLSAHQGFVYTSSEFYRDMIPVMARTCTRWSLRRSYE